MTGAVQSLPLSAELSSPFVGVLRRHQKRSSTFRGSCPRMLRLPTTAAESGVNSFCSIISWYTSLVCWAFANPLEILMQDTVNYIT